MVVLLLLWHMHIVLTAWLLGLQQLVVLLHTPVICKRMQQIAEALRKHNLAEERAARHEGDVASSRALWRAHFLVNVNCDIRSVRASRWFRCQGSPTCVHTIGTFSCLAQNVAKMVRK